MCCQATETTKITSEAVCVIDSETLMEKLVRQNTLGESQVALGKSQVLR